MLVLIVKAQVGFLKRRGFHYPWDMAQSKKKHNDKTKHRHRVFGGPGSFTTWVELAHPRQGYLYQSARRYRKTLAEAVHQPQRLQAGEAFSTLRHHWLKWWAPGTISWWIAVLFMCGAGNFALASAIELWPQVVGLNGHSVGYIYFVGSLFFTSAAYLQWLQALNRPLTELDRGDHARRSRWRYLGWQADSLGFLSASAQLLGTLLFNFNTADALLANLSWAQQDLLVWTPNILGSICFLVASQLAITEYCHSIFRYRPSELSWWIVVINWLGSLLFMISALANFIGPSTVLEFPGVVASGTLGGALCFFFAAYLLIPEQFERVT